MNRHTARLVLAVLSGWAVSYLGAAAFLPARAMLVVFALIIMIPVSIVTWPHRDLTGEHYPSWRGRRHPNPWLAGAAGLAIGTALAGWVAGVVCGIGFGLYIRAAWQPLKQPWVPMRSRYRLIWLTVALVAAVIGAASNMISIGPAAVLALDGELVRGAIVTEVHADRESAECVLARPDGGLIPGALYSQEGCGETEDVYASRHSLVDPVRVSDGVVEEAWSVSLFLLILPLLLCIPAAWPRRGKRSAI